MNDRERPSRSDRPLSTLKSGGFGVRAPDDRHLHRSVIQDAPVSRQAITRLLAPGKVEQPGSPPRPRDKVRSSRRVGRDTPAAAPAAASTTIPPAPGPVPASPAPSGATLRVSSAAELGAIVRLHRTQLGFSQQRLADLAGTGRRFVSELESGKPSLEFDRVVQCCAALGIDLFARARL
jgi:y4mF family transcriptional regulator